MKKEIDRMKREGVIRDSRSPYSSNIVLVKKKDDEDRFCIDFRRLNSMTKLDPFPLPNINEILQSLVGSKWFSKIDLRSGYWQIELDEESVKYTAFTSPFGHHEFTRMPFGLKNAPAYFSRVMNELLGHCRL